MKAPVVFKGSTMTENLFLTSEELAQLTGRKLKSQQIKWLKTSGLPFWVNARGHPVVTPPCQSTCRLLKTIETRG